MRGDTRPVCPHTGFPRRTAFVAIFVPFLSASRTAIRMRAPVFFCPSRYSGIIPIGGATGKTKKNSSLPCAGLDRFHFVTRQKTSLAGQTLVSRAVCTHKKKKKQKKTKPERRQIWYRPFRKHDFFPRNFRNYYCWKRPSTNGIVVLKTMNFIYIYKKKKLYTVYDRREKTLVARIRREHTHTTITLYNV